MPHSFLPLLSATPMPEGFSSVVILNPCFVLVMLGWLPLKYIYIWSFFSIKENLTNSEKQKEEKITYHFTTTVHILVYLSPRFLFFT